MKKYISPETIVVMLHVKHAVLQTSNVAFDATEGNQLGATEILSKEYDPVSDKSLWDNEW